MIWTILPFEGIETVKFGASLQEVKTAFGHPEDEIERTEEYLNVYYENLAFPVFGFRHKKLVDMVFGSRSGAVFVSNVDYFATEPKNFLEIMSMVDPDLRLSRGGAVVSPSLGIAFDKIPLGESDKNLTAFSRDELQKLLDHSARLLP